MYFTATMKANSITTYTIEGVDGIKEVPEVQPIDVEQIIVNKDQVTSSAAWNNGTTNVGTNVVDNNFPHSLMVLQTDMLRWISRQRCRSQL